MAAAGRAAFETNWIEERVMAAYGEAFARAAHARGHHELARALDAGAFEKGAA